MVVPGPRFVAPSGHARIAWSELVYIRCRDIALAALCYSIIHQVGIPLTRC